MAVIRAGAVNTGNMGWVTNGQENKGEDMDNCAQGAADLVTATT